MEKKAEEQENHAEKRQESGTHEDKKGSLEDLPGEVKDSPYLKYKDLEDYKRLGYGTEGHLQPKAGCAAGGTDAPTPSGGLPTEASATATDMINRQGVP